MKEIVLQDKRRIDSLADALITTQARAKEDKNTSGCLITYEMQQWE
jgi:hypothetical protein